MTTFRKKTVIIALPLEPLISDAMWVGSLWEVRRKLSVSCFRFLCDVKKVAYQCVTRIPLFAVSFESIPS